MKGLESGKGRPNKLKSGRGCDRIATAVEKLKESGLLAQVSPTLRKKKTARKSVCEPTLVAEGHKRLFFYESANSI